MIKLNTIQKRNKLNTVHAADEKGNGGANHRYLIELTALGKDEDSFVVQFQDGARRAENSLNGILDVDLLEIVRHRLQCFQEGDYATRDNEIALQHIEEALLWLNKRVEDRSERNVLGTDAK